MDESHWKDPEIFRPERHINDDGKLMKSDHLIPFGIGVLLIIFSSPFISNGKHLSNATGKRMCLGESLARNTFYLFTTALLKTFNFGGIPNEPLPTLNAVHGITNGYDGFKALVTPRQ